MPEAEIKKRGGAIRHRTIILKGKPGRKGTKYAHIAVVRKLGPKGGKTVMGKIHKVKESAEMQEQRFRFRLFSKIENYLSLSE